MNKYFMGAYCIFEIEAETEEEAKELFWKKYERKKLDDFYTEEVFVEAIEKDC